MAETSTLLPVLLSLIVPGSGQLRLGRRTRGWLILLISLVVIGLLLWLNLSPIAWVGLAAFWAANVWDVYQLTQGRRPNTALLLLAGLLPVYTIGWQVTEIDLYRFFTNSERARPVVQGLLSPNFAAQEIDYAIASTQYFMPCPAPEDIQQVSAPNGGALAITPNCGVPGDPIQVMGSGFEPNQQLEFWWINPVNAQSRVRIFGAFGNFSVDENGGFQTEIVTPNQRFEQDNPRANRLELRYVEEEGGYYLTETANLVMERIGETIAQALMATAVGALLAMPFSIFGARNLMAGNPILVALYYFSRTVMNVLRSIEPLIMAIVFVVWVGLGPFAGVLALTAHTIAALGKLYSESIESIDPGPIEAIRATGANQLQIIAYGVIPQVVPPWIAFTVFRWDINVRMSTIIGFVGGGGIGFLLAQWIRLSEYRSAGAAIWAIAVVVIILDYISARVRERLI